jgi:hypothetical protein
MRKEKKKRAVLYQPTLVAVKEKIGLSSESAAGNLR